MATSAKKYRVKGNIREWNDGAVITEADLEKYPELGGVARLRDEMGVLEEVYDAPPSEPAPATRHVIGGDDPNAPAAHATRRSGKS